MKAIKSSNYGRKCKFPHCKHILSIYNHDIYCHVHRGKLPEKKQPKATKPA